MEKPLFHFPTRPYTPIDALNRRAAAVGSPGYAMGAAHADYNGHNVSVSWNDYRRYHIAQYYWAGRYVLARGSFADCLAAATDYYNRGALGASVLVAPRADDTDAIALCRSAPGLVEGPQPQTPDWWTWRHTAAAESARDYANPGALCLMFDWELMQRCDSRDAYESALRTKYGTAFR